MVLSQLRFGKLNLQRQVEAVHAFLLKTSVRTFAKQQKNELCVAEFNLLLQPLPKSTFTA